jgi:5-methylcytosine-specific restriction enzyme A
MRERVRWYSTARWQRRARLQLIKEPLCRVCAKQGLIVPGEHADHVVPHRGSGRLFWFGELQSLCKPCHDRKTAEECGKRVRPAIGVDGWPIVPGGEVRNVGPGARQTGAATFLS